MATEVIQISLPAVSETGSHKDDVSLFSRPGRPMEAFNIEEAPPDGPSSGIVAAEDETQYPTGIRFWAIMVCYAMVLAFIGLDMSIVATAVPSITDEFHTVADVGWYSSAFRLCACSFAFMFGKVYTMFPVRPVFMACISLFMLGSLMGATAPSSLVFVVSRAVCGLSTAGIAQGCFYMLVHVVPLRKRPLYVGFLNGVEALANISSPSIGGLIVGSVGWRWCFWINLPIGALSLVIVFFALRIDLKGRSTLTLRQKLVELDLVGNLLFIPSLTSLFLALSWAGTKYPWNSGTVIGLLITFAVLLALFAYDQKRRGDRATLPPRILGNRSVLAGVVFGLCTNAAMNVFEYYLPTYFQSVRMYTATKSGIMMLPLMAGFLVAMLAHGAGVSALGYYVPFMLCASILMPIFAGLMTTFTTETALNQIAGYSLAMGFSAGIGFNAPQSAVQTMLPVKDTSTGIAIIYFAQNFGPAVFLAIAQTIFLNRLSVNLTVLVPGLSPNAVNNMGLTELRTLVGQDELGKALGILDKSLMQTWYLAVGLTCVTIIGSITMEWGSVKDKKQD
ncbi:efflux pump antibiotic resistance protein [Diaporthe sp. PMI_573]|nr:efflux pump antibiotic resistance protein [Diaporthaceae sp. PMI_573]